MSIISKLFGKSPFEPLHQHMLKVKACVGLVRPLMGAFLKGEQEKVKDVAKKIFKAEHDADMVKKEIRSNLPKGIFLPVARGDILRFLKEQDNIADSAEDLAALLILRKTTVPEELKEKLKSFVDKVLETYEVAMTVSSEIKLLAETSFGGEEAHKVMELIEQLKVKEWEADKAQMIAAKKMFSIEKKLDPVSVMMWMHIFKELGTLANHAENAGDQM
ncbi:MAG TPA: TIGR00153 family protein, partial [Candidatus Aminicenantes bacterium]|nr:TIGR00153 family protein [Candidatus Aminicenantes bacterium]